RERTRRDRGRPRAARTERARREAAAPRRPRLDRGGLHAVPEGADQVRPLEPGASRRPVGAAELRRDPEVSAGRRLRRGGVRPGACGFSTRRKNAAASSRFMPERSRLSIGVSIVPGATAFTRMPWGPTSGASALAAATRPALAAAYGTQPGSVTNAWTDEMRTM